jgi:hypothetical protein
MRGRGGCRGGIYCKVSMSTAIHNMGGGVGSTNCTISTIFYMPDIFSNEALRPDPLAHIYSIV